MEAYYIKKGERYIPCGWQQVGNYIPFGVWYSKKTESGSSHTNILYWDDVEVLDIRKAIKQIDFADVLVKILHKLREEGKFSVYDMSLADLAKLISKETITKDKRGEK